MEYTTLTQERCAPDNHARIIDCIERYGDWHMGDPYSSDPEQRPNVINRTWLDVRRHEENVKHFAMTAEEIELLKHICSEGRSRLEPQTSTQRGVLVVPPLR